MDALPAGTRLHQNAFIIERTLASSNFSFTYLAREETLRRAVALKEFFPLGCRREDGAKGVLPPAQPAAFEAAREKFLQEARILAGFHHSGIVAVHTFFEENNTAYMAMEFLSGQTLAQQLTSRRLFSESEAIEIATRVGATLEVVHGGGFLHCDLTPDNIFQCDDGSLVLLDFGLSTRLNISHYGTRSLNDALRFGTPGYAPLEQYAVAGVLSPATDVYSLAATLYHLLTGQAPAPATDRAYGVDLVSPRALNAGLSLHLDAAILRGLQMSPAARPASAREFAADLRQGKDFEMARRKLIGLFQARAQQLQQRPKQTTPDAPKPAVQARATNPAPPAPDDSGCVQFAFVAYLILWLFAGVICMAWLFLQFIHVRW